MIAERTQPITITIADGVTYTPRAARSGPPNGTLHAKGADWYMTPFLAPHYQDGHEFLGSARVPGTDRAMHMSKRVWLVMTQADRDAAGVVEDVAATHERHETERKRIANENAARKSAPRPLTERQQREKAYDDVQNEGAYGYNPHRSGDRPTYWPDEGTSHGWEGWWSYAALADGFRKDPWVEVRCSDEMQRHLHNLKWGVEKFEDDAVE